MPWWFDLLVALSVAAVGMGWYPCCCVNCDLGSDPWVSGDWTVVAGSWTIGTDYVTSTTSNGLILWKNESSTARVRINTVNNAGGAFGDEIGLVLAYTDANNYLFVLMQDRGSATNRTISLYKRSGGVDTLLKSTITGTGHDSVRACYDGTYLSVAWSSPGVLGMIAKAAGFTGTKVGVCSRNIGTSGTITGIDFLEHRYHGSQCPECPTCAACDDGYIAEDYTMSISGVTISTGSADKCTALNATHTLTPTSTRCIRARTFTSGSERHNIQLKFGIGYGAEVTAELYLEIGFANYVLMARYTSSDSNCMESGKVLSKTFEETTYDYCNYPATITISPV